MYRIRGDNANEAWDEFKWTFPGQAMKEDSRNGPVMSVQEGSVLEIDFPMQRVLFDPTRDCNHFFHVMEFVWLMTGDSSVGWITQFNKTFINYSDDGKTFPASYGVRWAEHWNYNQIAGVINQLREDPTSRRAVIGMWDPGVDFSTDSKAGADRPCNMVLSFRVIGGELHMFAYNRSNDAIWGMFGANMVHMTLLQELIAKCIGLRVGRYTVFSANLHTYTNLRNYESIMRKGGGSTDYYSTMGLVPYPLLSGKEGFSDFLEDARSFVMEGTIRTQWFKRVAYPIYRAYLDKANRAKWCANIDAQDWRVACTQWAERR